MLTLAFSLLAIALFFPHQVLSLWVFLVRFLMRQMLLVILIMPLGFGLVLPPPPVSLSLVVFTGGDAMQMIGGGCGVPI
jgi:hypothetical protein